MEKIKCVVRNTGMFRIGLKKSHVAYGMLMCLGSDGRNQMWPTNQWGQALFAVNIQNKEV